jgi:hypothetical protein
VAVRKHCHLARFPKNMLAHLSLMALLDNRFEGFSEETSLLLGAVDATVV